MEKVHWCVFLINPKYGGVLMCVYKVSRIERTKIDTFKGEKVHIVIVRFFFSQAKY